MRGKNKKKSNPLDKKNLSVFAIAAATVAAIAFVMSSLLPSVEKSEKGFEQSAWEEALKEAEDSLEEKSMEVDSGMTNLYDDEASISVASDALPVNSENDKNQEKKEVGDTPDTSSDTSQNQNSTSTEASPDTTYIPPIDNSIINDYSADDLVYSETMQDWRTHNGIDYAADEGSEIFSVADGTVEAITENSLLGTTVIILHGNGLRSIYANLADSPFVEVGAYLSQGTALGRVGSTAALEAAAPPHLHFEMSLNEATVNPHDYIK